MSENSSNFAALPVVSKSLAPLDLPDSEMPFGSPPPGLEEIESTAEPVDAYWGGRIRALAINGEKLRSKNPMKAASCWHEAGRLLERRAGRVSEAWRCHSYALALAPEYKPARDALRRLARLVGDDEVLLEILDSGISSRVHPVEASAILSEIGALQMIRGDDSSAQECFSKAFLKKRDSFVPLLFGLALAGSRGDDDEMAEVLGHIVERWTDPVTESMMGLVLALNEERNGRYDDAYRRLMTEDVAPELVAPKAWARLRIAVRTGDWAGAGDAVSVLAQELKDSEHLRIAVFRIGQAIRIFAQGDVDDDGAEKIVLPESDRLLDLFDAVSKGSLEQQVASCQELACVVKNTRFASSLAVRAIVAEQEGGKNNVGLGDKVDKDSPSALGAALRYGFSSDFMATIGRNASKEPEAVIGRAFFEENWEELVQGLERVRMGMTNWEDIWSCAVAESSVRYSYKQERERAYSLLRDLAPDLSVQPLPLLARYVDRSSSNLTSLALDQAKYAESEEAAWLYAWGAHKQLEFDREGAISLFRRSLELQPNCELSLISLEREEIIREELAENALAAAAVTQDHTERARYMARAGLHFLMDGQNDRATMVLSQAMKFAPEDKELWHSVIQLASGSAQPKLMESILSYEPDLAMPTVRLLQVAIAALEDFPEHSVRWFNALLERTPDDPLAIVGRREALMANRDLSTLTAEFRAELESATVPSEFAAMYQRLMDVESRFGDGDDAGINYLHELVERLPGHRSSLVHLLINAYEKNDDDLLVSILDKLSNTSMDKMDSAAFASTAWQISSGDLQRLRLAIAKDSDGVWDLIELETLTEDPGERTRLLRELVRKFPAATSSNLRYAGFLLQDQQLEPARQMLELAVDRDPNLLAALFLLADQLRQLEDHSALSNVLEKIAEKSRVESHRISAMLEVAGLIVSSGKEHRRAIGHYAKVLEIDPKNDLAYETARKLLSQKPDKDMLATVLENRVAGVDDLERRRQVHLELARLLIDLNRRGRAKQHIDLALRIDSNDTDTLSWASSLYEADGQWQKGIEYLVAAAKNVTDPLAGIDVFFKLGCLYMDRAGRLEMAEKSFLKVLSWDRTHLWSLKRLVELYLKVGNSSRAVQAIEHVIGLLSDGEEKVTMMVTLAEIFESQRNRIKDAEGLLSEARRIAPLDIRPVLALVSLLKRTGDNVSLAVHVDQSLAVHSKALVDDPDELLIYSNIEQLWRIKGCKSLAKIAVQTGELLGEKSSAYDDEEIIWDIGGRLGDGRYDELLCPSEISAGVRQSFKEVEPVAAKLIGVSAKQVVVDRDAKLSKKHPLVKMLNELSTLYRVSCPNVYGVSDKGLRLYPGSTPILLVPSVVASSTDEAIHRYVSNYALQLSRLGLGISTVVDAKKLRIVFAAIIRVSIPDYTPGGLDSRDVDKWAVRLKEELSASTLKRVAPFAYDCTIAVESPRLAELIVTIGERAGFIGAGALSGTIRAKRLLQGVSSGPFVQLFGTGHLLSFVFSRNHLALRRRLGIEEVSSLVP